MSSPQGQQLGKRHSKFRARLGGVAIHKQQGQLGVGLHVTLLALIGYFMWSESQLTNTPATEPLVVLKTKGQGRWRTVNQGLAEGYVHDN